MSEPPSRTVLFVHGAWHGPWCWDEWAGRLETAGHATEAVTLPGHGAPGTRRRIWNRLGEYVDTVVEALDRLGPETVVVGHSMGGLVTQRALERRSAALAVLLASVPLGGVLGATVRTARRIPASFVRTNATVSMYAIVGSPELSRGAFFTGATPDATVKTTLDRLQNESYLAYLQMFVNRPRPGRVTTPVKVIAAEQDAIFSVEEERALADAYDTEAVVIAGAGHDVMLDPAGDEAYHRLVGWIDELR